jgi:hypothetical protein
MYKGCIKYIVRLHVAFRLRTPTSNVTEMRSDFKELRYQKLGHLKITLIGIQLKATGGWIVKQEKFSCN